MGRVKGGLQRSLRTKNISKCQCLECNNKERMKKQDGQREKGYISLFTVLI